MVEVSDDDRDGVMTGLFSTKSNAEDWINKNFNIKQCDIETSVFFLDEPVMGELTYH